MKQPRKTAQRAQSIASRLHQHWREFIERVHACVDHHDDTALRAVVESFGLQVQKAAKAGVETSITWHSLGMWTVEAAERISCFTHALACIAREEMECPAGDDLARWTYAHYKALCRFEIARAFAGQGQTATARSFLEQALPFARAAEDMPVQGPTLEGSLEGRIAGELLLLEP